MKKYLNNNSKRIWIIFALTMLLSIAIIVGFFQGIFTSSKVKALECVAIPNAELLEKYNLNTTINIPDGKILYNEKEYEPDEKYVIKPNGVIIRGNNLRLDSIGNYTLVYSKKEDDYILNAKKRFCVNNEVYSVSSSKSSVEYGPLNHGFDGESGIKISLVNGDKFTYNQPIDLSSTGMDKPILRYYTNHNTKRLDVGNMYREFSSLYITFTDCYDSNNAITFFTMWDFSTNRPYFRASATGQASVGLTREETKLPSQISKEYFADGVRYLAYYNTFGTFYHYIFRQLQSEGLGVSVYFDMETNRLYLKGKYMDIIADLDDPDMYGGTLFKGFTTGEVLMSIYAEDYEKEKATIEIGYLNGSSGDDLNKTIVTDERSPDINIQTDGVSDLNNITIAKNENVKIFSATATDVNGCGEIKPRVYYNYGLSSQTQVGSKNGFFVPTKEGNYTIVYDSTDGYGNYSIKTISMRCVTAPNNRIISFDVENLTDVNVGETIILPAPNVNSLNGDVQVKAYLINKGKRIDIESGNREFALFSAGSYQIVYEYTDYIYSYSYSYFINAVSNNYIRFSNYYLPLGFIKNAKYTLDAVTAVEYGNQTTPLTVTSQISEDGGSYRDIDVTDFKIQANNNVKFKFIAKESFIETETVPVTDVGFGSDLNMSKYFIGNYSGESQVSCVRLISNSNTADNSLEFANVLLLSQFVFGFSIPEEYSNFEKLKIQVIDFYNRDKVSTIVYKNVNDKMSVSYNGGTEQTKNNPFFGQNVNLSYVDGIFTDSLGTVLTNTVDYKTNKVVLKVTLENINGDSAVDILKISNQSFSNATVDRIKPLLAIDYSDIGRKGLNSKLVIKEPEVVDVLSPFYANNLFITITSPSEKFVTSTSSKLLDGNSKFDTEQEIVFNEIGSYYVSISYTDQSKRNVETTFVIEVVDVIPPTISIDGVPNDGTIFKEGAKLGSNVKVKNYKVSDNIYEQTDLVVHITVFGPDYSICTLSNGEFTANKKGEYKIYYHVFDIAGNYTVTHYIVSVS